MFASLIPLQAGVLSGRHVRLEPLALHHLEGLTAIANGPRETFTWTTLPAGVEPMRLYVATAIALAEAGAAVPFATLDAVTGQVVGCTRFANLEHCQLPVGDGRPAVRPWAVEIGWTWLAPHAQRTGINTEAKLLMLGHAFEQWGLGRVVLKTHQENARSRAAIERIGGQPDGFNRTHGPGGTTRPTAWYSLGVAEWPENKARLLQRLAERASK